MSIAVPRRRTLAGAVIFSLAIGGLSIAPLSATAAVPAVTKSEVVFNAINAGRAGAETPQLSSSDALDVIAQKYAAASAAKGKVATKPTVVPADSDAEAPAPTFDFAVASFSSKLKAEAAYGKLNSTIVLNPAFDFAGIGYATKGTKTFVVALVADYSTAPLETQFATKSYLTGAPTVGNLLVAHATFAETPDSVSYEWIVDGENVGNFSGNLLPLFVELYGTRISAKITATKAGYAPLVITTATTPKIGRTTVKATLSVEGDRNVGRTLYAEAYPTSFYFVSSPSISYQWYRGSSKIVDATSQNYTQTPQDLNKKIWVRSKISGPGFTTFIKDSSRSIVTKGKQIEYTSGVSISWANEGNITVGTVATVNVGDWLDQNPEALVSPGIGLSIQWLLNGKAVKGATGESYTVPASAATKNLSVRVTGKQAGRQTTVRTSSSSYIAGLEFEASPSLVVAGDFVTGKTLKAVVTGVPAGAKVSYEWASAFSATGIRGATSKSLKLTKAMVDSHAVVVYVTISRAGYNTISRQAFVTDLTFIGIN